MDRDHALSILAEARLAERLVGSELAARLALLATFDPQRLGDEPAADDVVRLLCRRLPARDGRQVAMLDDRWRIEAVTALLRAGGPPLLRRVRSSVEAHHDSPLQHMVDAFVDGRRLPVDMTDENDLLAALDVWRWASEALARARLSTAVSIEPGRDVIESRLALLDVTRAVRRLADAGCVGRERELKHLHAYRLSAALPPGPGGEPAMVVHGIGGIGKSTLVARFVMDLFGAVERGERLAWAYLDLDRPSLSSGDPSGVLDDVVRQIGAQFPDHRRVLEHSRDVAHRRTKGAGLESSDTAASYRQRVAGFAAAMRSIGVESLVVVLDTVEELERSAPARAADLDDLFAAWASELPRFRLVVAGRRPPAVFVDPRRPDRQLHLLALDDDAAGALLRFFVQRSPQPPAHRIDDALVRQVVGLVGGIPLTLRLAANVLVREGAAAVTDAAARARAVDRVREEFVRGFLYQRILGHVRAGDPARTAELRQVARAGLVLRWITPALVGRVLLPDGPAARTSTAEQVFDELASEVALVERDGDVLRLREELRGPALAALRLDDPQLVARLHRRAAEFFAAEPGAAAAVEFAYHRIALGDPATGFDAAVLRGLLPSVADLPEAAAALVRRAVDDPAGLAAVRDLAARERAVLAEADAALRNGETHRAGELLAAAAERPAGTELHRLDSRLAESRGDLAGAVVAARRDLAAATAAAGATRVAAAGVRLSGLLERQGRHDDAAAVLQETADAPLLAAHPELRLELLLNRLTLLERAGHLDERLRWTLGLDVRALVQRSGPRTVTANSALARLLAAALGREEPERIRQAARLIGLGHEEDRRRVLVLVAELAAWDSAPPEPGRLARLCGLPIDGSDVEDVRRAWTVLAGLGTDAGLLLERVWSWTTPPEPVREALRMIYLWWGVAAEPDDPAVDRAPHFLAGQPLDWSRPETLALEDVVLTAYPSPTEVRMLADRAGLDPAGISWSTTSRRITRELLGNAGRAGRLDALVGAVLDDPDAAAVHERLRALVGTAWLRAHRPPPEPTHHGREPAPRKDPRW